MSKPTTCQHLIEHRESYIEGSVYTCYCGKNFTVEDLINEIHLQRQMIDDADRRAGRAERLLGAAKATVAKEKTWKNEQKVLLGYHEKASFRLVWHDIIDVAGGEEWLRDELLKLPNAKRRKD